VGYAHWIAFAVYLEDCHYEVAAATEESAFLLPCGDEWKSRFLTA